MMLWTEMDYVAADHKRLLIVIILFILPVVPDILYTGLEVPFFS